MFSSVKFLLLNRLLNLWYCFHTTLQSQSYRKKVYSSLYTRITETKLLTFQVFLKPEEKYEHLQTYICEQTSVVAESQILLYQDRLLSTEVEENTPAKTYPDTTAEEPLMLYNKNNNNVTLQTESDIPKFPVFPNIVSVENDATQAKVPYLSAI